MSDEAVLPELLRLPLAERVRLIERGDLGLREWLAEANEWGFAADVRYRACADLRPATEAVRLGVKDTVDVAGFPTRLGLRRYRHHPRRSAAPLRGVGIEVTAKVVTTELNIGIGSGCVNPNFPHIDPAGSSTGSGVSVAANICDVSLGTDVLGSVRWPAAHCGVVGLRTTHDPENLDGIFPLSPPMDAVGWVARTADDLAFAWEYLGLGRRPEPGRRRIALVEEIFEGGCADEVLAAVETVSWALKDAGHEIGRARLGELWDCRGLAWELCSADAWRGHQVWGGWLNDDLHESTWAALRSGARISAERHAELSARLVAQRAAVPALFDVHDADFWLLPLDPDVPRPIGTHPRANNSTIPGPDDADYDSRIGYTPVASFGGLPAITFPAAVGAEHGAPIAAQLVGRPGTDADLIRLARDIADQRA
jgi:Asp-tRNA(Asn)/Glu-tRNA(Gln) amidotransferase A subunit family amidase